MSAPADPEPFKPLHGECVCGSLKYTVLQPPLGKVGLCHCHDCKRQTGSMFSANVLVPRDALKIEGEYKCWSRPSDQAKRAQDPDSKQREKDWGLAFCPNCGTQFCAFPDSMPHMAVLRIGTLDPEDIERLGRPEMEMFCKRRLAWPEKVEGASQWEEWPFRG